MRASTSTTGAATASPAPAHAPARRVEDAFAALVKHVGAGNGDIVFFGAGGYNKVSDFMGALRLKAGKDFGLVQDGWKPLWVTDFPMFEWDEDAQRYVALHHPFTAPAVDDIADLRANAKTAVSRGYDMVLNGNEIGGGSIRIHRPEMQSAVFELLGIGAEEQRGNAVGLQDGDLALNQPGAVQAFGAAQAGRRRDLQLLGQRLVALRGIGLQRIEQLQVDAVEFK